MSVTEDRGGDASGTASARSVDMKLEVAEQAGTELPA